jgi:hypothetical protein
MSELSVYQQIQDFLKAIIAPGGLFYENYQDRYIKNFRYYHPSIKKEEIKVVFSDNKEESEKGVIFQENNFILSAGLEKETYPYARYSVHPAPPSGQETLLVLLNPATGKPEVTYSLLFDFENQEIEDMSPNLEMLLREELFPEE